MKRSILMGAVACLLLSFPALAQQHTVTATGVFQSATVGTSSAQVIPFGTANIYLLLHNPSAPGGNIVYCREGTAAQVSTAGNLSIAPGQYLTMESTLVDGGAWNCISTGASTPFTYGAK